MKILHHASITFLFSLMINVDAVYSITFKFDPILRPQLNPPTLVSQKRINKLHWMDDLAVKLNEQVSSMENALNNPNSHESSICRTIALGPLNERQGIKGDLYRSFAATFERIQQSNILVKDVDMKMHTPRGYISLTEYFYRDEWLRELNGKALHVADEFFDLPEADMLDNLLHAVFLATHRFTADQFLISRKRKYSGKFDVKVYQPQKPFDSKIYEVVTATTSQRQNYDRILSQPTGAQLSYLNPNVYIEFARCLDIATGRNTPERSIGRINIKIN